MSRRTKIILLSLVALSLLFLSASPAMAQGTTKSVEQIKTALDTVWVLIAGSLVFIMQLGFFFLEGGLTRAKNVSNAMLKGAMDFCLGALIFWMIGYGIMFGTDAGGFMGTNNFFLNAVNPTRGNLPTYVFLFFQIAFAGAAATILAGGIAERLKYSAYVIATICITGLIYPFVGHWIWAEGGWLARLGMIDFAGSTVVHTVGGTCAFVGALMLGPRLGKYGRDGKVNAIPGHSIPMVALGTFILWLGWFGFNPGSTLSASPAIAHIVMTTTLAGAAGGTAAMFLTWARYGKSDVSMSMNGILAGLVAVTAGCASVSPVSAVIIGTVAGILVVFSVEFIDKKLKVDDPVGATSVHCVCGVWGTLAVGLFAQASFGRANGIAAVNGLFYGGGLKQLGLQALGSVSTLAWVGATAALMFYVIKKVVGIRVGDDDQRIGLDIAEHNVEAYPEFLQVPQDQEVA
ncbi:MAG: ammonium transporter [Actinobacteria bacterium]|nr:ammonium transporter [Actinomycetota bacterium]MBU1944397.1 ammonium transporter [Actinomycetota bacterium]MBU2688265.1 ammonium transporter [Actinomycetota bacterium]